MATTYHLRPVSDISPSPSPTASTTPPSDSPQYKGPGPIRHSPPSANPRTRRPLSPSSLRDVDVSHTHDSQTRNPKYPAPPTGHELMAMFPPPPPDNFPEMRPGPTSGFFQRQERAFFAQAGKEIVRVRIEIDLPHGAEDPKTRARSYASPSLMNAPAQAPPPTSSLYSHSTSRQAPPRSSGPTPTSLFPHPSSHSTSPSSMAHPPQLHPPAPGLRTPPQDGQPEEYDDEAWRRPMPYAERRRAGKHTKRIIVKT